MPNLSHTHAHLSHPSEKGLLSFSEACDALSISQGTGRNWVRLGKLSAAGKTGRSLAFAASEIERILSSIASGESSALSRRRNKRRMRGFSLPDGYIENQANAQAVRCALESRPGGFGEKESRCLLANFALQLVLGKTKGKAPKRPPIWDFLSGRLDCGGFAPLVEDLAGLPGEALATANEMGKRVFESRMEYAEGEDALGFAYLSLLALSDRKAAGAYYTPMPIARELVEAVRAAGGFGQKPVFDPCCGSGNFLLLLGQGISPPELLYGQDLDAVAIALARISFALATGITSRAFLFEHFVRSDSLASSPLPSYGVVLGNPPWGGALSREERKRLCASYQTAKASGAETCDLFVERGLDLLGEGGILAYAMPEAVFTVKRHRAARELLAKGCTFRFAHYLGSAFGGVNCPSVLLGAQKTSHRTPGVGEVRAGGERYRLATDRQISSERLGFRTKDEEQDCLDAMDAIPGKATLAEGARFALGIVTGDNAALVSRQHRDGWEPVLKGSDIQRFRHREAASFIRYAPSDFQQSAPAEVYRAPEKLFYRFVSQSLVFSYDSEKALSLNSCNILIPLLKGLAAKYILAVLNSSAASFYYMRMFSSVKVLRSHIESIPIPRAGDAEQRDAIRLVDEILTQARDSQSVYRDLDDLVFSLYSLPERGKSVVARALKGQNRHLPA
jgi:predicted RNA methylase